MGRITKHDYYEVLLHWEKNVVASIMGDVWNKSNFACSFCNKLRDKKGHVICFRCPVYKNTGHMGCDETPWSEAWCEHPDSNWEEYQYLLTLALSNGMADEYLNEIEWEE